MSLTFALLLTLVPSVTPPACRPATASPQVVIEHAVEAVGLASVGDRVRTSVVTDVLNMPYQSDRMYPPYLWSSREMRTAVDWERGLHRMEQGKAPAAATFLSDGARRAIVSPRATMLLSDRQLGLLDERAMDPWMVLADWRRAADVRVAGECVYRDYWRLVLERKTSGGVEQLFVDPKNGMPVKLERREPHYLWGDVRAEYLWSIWSPVRGSRALAPQYAFRIVDGETDEQRYAAQHVLVPRDSAGVLAIPAAAVPAPDPVLQNPDTVRVAPSTFLLVTRAYTSVVALLRDTVFVLDAQISAERAQQDSAWIGKLFPGRHPVVLVVTDLAWPHIAGVRHWVALGATVVSHSGSRAFLDRVVSRRWISEPDLLERRRATVRFRFRPVTAALSLAGGDLQVHAIDGAGSEGALMAFFPRDRFLYAGDFIQGGGPESFSAVYAREVAAAVQRAGLVPNRFAAMHVPLTDWSSLGRFTGQP